MALEKLTEMWLNETYSKRKILSDMFPIKNGLKQGDALLSLPFNFAIEYALEGFRQTRYTSASGYADYINVECKHTYSKEKNGSVRIRKKGDWSISKC
jgi:hypothetical protein